MEDERFILLVEDNPDDEELSLRALRKNNIANKALGSWVVARDGVEALDFLFAQGAFADRNPLDLPVVVLLDLKLPKVDGLEAPWRIRSTDTTKLLPVVILTSSTEEKDLVNGYSLGANSYNRKPVDFSQFSESVRQLGLYWIVFNETLPVPGGAG